MHQVNKAQGKEEQLKKKPQLAKRKKRKRVEQAKQDKMMEKQNRSIRKKVMEIYYMIKLGTPDIKN